MLEVSASAAFMSAVGNVQEVLPSSCFQNFLLVLGSFASDQPSGSPSSGGGGGGALKPPDPGNPPRGPGNPPPGPGNPPSTDAGKSAPGPGKVRPMGAGCCGGGDTVLICFVDSADGRREPVGGDLAGSETSHRSEEELNENPLNNDVTWFLVPLLIVSVQILLFVCFCVEAVDTMLVCLHCPVEFIRSDLQAGTGVSSA